METLLQIAEWLFTNVWALFTEVRVPLLNISAGSLAIGILLIDVFLGMFGRILGVAFPTLPSGLEKYNSSSGRSHSLNPNRLPAHSSRYRVSPERANDER